MADCLVYYKDYWIDGDFTDNWYTRQEHWYRQAETGDCLWVVVSAGPQDPGEWRLLQKLVIKEVGYIEELDYRTPSEWGRPYHAACDLDQSQFYDIEAQPDFAPILKQLNFASNKPIKASGALIGRTIQSNRPLSDNDIETLEDYARKLRAVPR